MTFKSRNRRSLFFVATGSCPLNIDVSFVREPHFAKESTTLSDGLLSEATLRGEVGGWGRVPFSKNLMSPTPRRKW